MFHDNDSKLAVNLESQLDKKELTFIINKSLFIPCYTINCDLSLDSLQHNIVQYSMSLKIYSMSQNNMKRTN